MVSTHQLHATIPTPGYATYHCPVQIGSIGPSAALPLHRGRLMMTARQLSFIHPELEAKAGRVDDGLISLFTGNTLFSVCTAHLSEFPTCSSSAWGNTSRDHDTALFSLFNLERKRVETICSSGRHNLLDFSRLHDQPADLTLSTQLANVFV